MLALLYILKVDSAFINMMLKLRKNELCWSARQFVINLCHSSNPGIHLRVQLTEKIDLTYEGCYTEDNLSQKDKNIGIPNSYQYQRYK